MTGQSHCAAEVVPTLYYIVYNIYIVLHCLHCTAEVVPTEGKAPFCATPANLLQLDRTNTKRHKDKDKEKIKDIDKDNEKTMTKTRVCLPKWMDRLLVLVSPPLCGIKANNQSHVG